MLTTCGVAAALSAFTRPQFGYVEQEVGRAGRDVFVLLDTSRSMLAEDLRPNRLERSKIEILDLLDGIPGDRVGLITYAGTPIVQVPLTLDREYFKTFLEEADVKTVPNGGSNLGQAIERAIQALGAEAGPQKIIIVFSDGDDHEGRIALTVAAARSAGVVIYAVGVGDHSRPSNIRVGGTDENPTYLRIGGDLVTSQLEEANLKSLTESTGGRYVRLIDGGVDFTSLFRRSGDQSTGEFDGKIRSPIERFQFPLAIAVAMLIAERLLSTYAYRPPLDLSLSTYGAPS
jgi:Ca-activated chloride channel family protein